MIHQGINCFNSGGDRECDHTPTSRASPPLTEVGLTFEQLYSFAANVAWGTRSDEIYVCKDSLLHGTSISKSWYRGVISTFSWGGANFFFVFSAIELLKNWKKQHFISSILTLFIVPCFYSCCLSFFFSFFSSFFFFSFFFLFPWGEGGDGPPAPLKWRPCRDIVCHGWTI